MLHHEQFTSTDEMIAVVKAIGKELALAVPCELTVGNLVRRVLFTIREVSPCVLYIFGYGP